MPLNQWTIGNQTLPVPTSGANSRFRDPTIVGLLDYFAFWIREAISTKLAEMGGPVNSSPIIDACPSAHCFPWNHNSSFMRPHNVAGVMTVPLPGMWMWWTEATMGKQQTLWFDSSQRICTLHYIFPELQIPDGYNARSGLEAVALNAIQLACTEGRHPEYAPPNAAAGAWIPSVYNLIAFEFLKGSIGRLSQKPNNSITGNRGSSNSEGATQRFYPALEATISVQERIGRREPDPINDLLEETTIGLYHGDDADDGILILERIVPDNV